ncbi:hypothetical protein F4V58_01670 [Corynebacterium phocae]|nr:hypothetical protein F4V58_01670 [Corynebacterium phocae]
MPPEIYRRRRMAALGVILLLVLSLLGLWAALSGGSEPDKQSAPYPSSTTTSAASQTTTTSVTVKATATETVVPAESEPAVAAAPAPAPAERKATCELEDLVIGAELDQPTYAPGAQPVMKMTVENPTAADCVVDLSTLTMRFEVYDMGSNHLVWTDTDCSPPVDTGLETFAPGKTREFSATWSRLGSTPGQCEAREPVEPGAYFLHTVIGRHASAPQPFNLA